MTAQTLTGMETGRSTSFGKLWATLTTPADAVKGEKRQRAATLAALLLVFMPLALIVTFITPVTNWLNGAEFEPPTPSTLGGLVLIVAAYWLSRTKYHEIASYIVIASPILAVTGTIFTSDTPANPITLLFLLLSIILSSLLLDARGTFIAGFISVVLIVMAYNRPTETQLISWPLVMLVVIATSIMALVSYIRDGYIVSLEAARKELQEQVELAEQARARAERSDQVKSAFLASMSHELRTPLNAVINFTRFVIDGDTGPVNEQQSELLTEVVGSARHLLNLINDVLDMSKIEAGSLNLFIEDDISLNALLNSVVSTGRSLIKDKPVQIQTEIEEQISLISGDRQRILQILLNIVSNACKFTEAGEIKIKAYQKGGEIVIAITDTGPGIAAADQAMVFEAFKQTQTGLRQGGGTGLGMPIAKSLAEAHGGRLWLESEQGKGASFFVTLPVKSETLVPLSA